MSALDEIRAERVVGEPQRIRYESRYAGIVKRMFLGGFSPEETAAYIGVTLHTLKEWRDEHPEMLAAWRATAEYNGRIAEAIFNQAMEYDEERGEWVGKNAQLMRFLAQARLGWREQGLPDASMPQQAQVRLGKQEAVKLMSKLAEKVNEDAG